MKELLKSISKLSIPSIINILSSLLRNKLLAIVVGPAGLGIYSQLVNLSNLIFAILPIGSIGLIRYTSNYYESNKKAEITFLFKYFFKRNILISFILSILIIVLRKYISNLIFSNSEFSNLLILLSFVVPINILAGFIDIYLKGIRKINLYVLFLSLSSILSILFTIPLIYFAGVLGAVLAFISNIIFNVIVGFFIIKKFDLSLNFKITTNVENSTIKNIYKFGIATLVSIIVQNIAALLIKSTMAARLNLQDVGLFQSVYSISTGYFGVFFALMSTYSIPKLSSLNTGDEINKEINNTVKLLLLVYTPIIVSLFVLRSFVINALYSSDFDLAKHLFIFQLPAEFFRAFSWVMGLWLIPGLKIKQWVIFEVIYYLLFVSFFYVFIDLIKIGLKSASISYLISYMIFFLINYVYFVKKNHFKFSQYNLRIIFVSVLFLALCFFFSLLYESVFYYIFIPILLIWAWFVINKEDLNQLVQMIKSRIDK